MLLTKALIYAAFPAESQDSVTHCPSVSSPLGSGPERFEDQFWGVRGEWLGQDDVVKLRLRFPSWEWLMFLSLCRLPGHREGGPGCVRLFFSPKETSQMCFVSYPSPSGWGAVLTRLVPVAGMALAGRCHPASP